MENDHQLRILYLYQILLRHSDVDHPVSTKELIDMMETYHQIKLHRTTIPKYIELLNAGGLEVMEIRSREKKYYLNDRLFEPPEVKLLIDAVQSSKFISVGKSQVLISKLMALTSEANAAKLKRNLYVTGRVKSDNEKSYYIVEAINDAINEGKRISFYYTDYNTQKERVLKNDGLPYVISPYALIWDGDFYYVLGLNHSRNCFLQALFPQKCRLTSSKLHGEFPHYCISSSGTLSGAGEESLQAYCIQSLLVTDM